MSDKNNSYSKPMCGLWHANVAVSLHNENGKCECLKCFGTHCHDCATYQQLADEISLTEPKTRCQLCQMYQEKTR